MDGEHRELLKGSLDLLLLVLLDEAPRYGYEIGKALRERSGDVLRLKEGSLYPALHRLAAAGLLESYWQPRPDGADRRYYRLTEAGRAALPARRAAWHRFTTAVAGVVGDA
jgi:DNA-binding PadR family transcriptional regulator